MTTLNLQVGAGADDYWGWSSGSFGSAEQRAGTQFGGQYRPFARFTSVTIANAATINSATLTIVARSGGDTATCLVVICADNKDNQAAYANSGDIDSNFAATTATVNWTLSTTWTGGATQTSPDISTVIQEIVNRAGWVSGNALQVVMNYNATSGSRYFDAYDNSSANATKLDITYTAGGGAQDAPELRAGRFQMRQLLAQ